MAAAAGSSNQLLNCLVVCVLDEKKKSSYLLRRISNFPVVENVDEFRSKLANILPDLSNKLLVNKCQIGYILTKNKKNSIISSSDLEAAYGFFTNGNHLWIDPASVMQDFQTKEDQSKTKATTATATKAGNKRPLEVLEPKTKQEKLVEIMDELKEKHGNVLSPYKFRLWAEMIHVGTADKDNIPNLPMFNATPAKRPAKRADAFVDALNSAGAAIAGVMQTSQPSTPSAPTTANRPNTSRADVLKQLKDLFELKTMGAITEQEYEEKKPILMKDLL